MRDGQTSRDDTQVVPSRHELRLFESILGFRVKIAITAVFVLAAFFWAPLLTAVRLALSVVAVIAIGLAAYFGAEHLRIGRPFSDQVMIGLFAVCVLAALWM